MNECVFVVNRAILSYSFCRVGIISVSMQIIRESCPKKTSPKIKGSISKYRAREINRLLGIEFQIPPKILSKRRKKKDFMPLCLKPSKGDKTRKYHMRAGEREGEQAYNTAMRKKIFECAWVRACVRASVSLLFYVPMKKMAVERGKKRGERLWRLKKI